MISIVLTWTLVQFKSAKLLWSDSKAENYFIFFTSIATIIKVQKVTRRCALSQLVLSYNIKPTETLYNDTDQSMSFNVNYKERKLF